MKKSSALTFLCLTMIPPVEEAQARNSATSFMLPAGTGCEHIAVLPGPDGIKIAVTSRTEHRAWRQAPDATLGFAFIGLKEGRPALLGTQPPSALPVSQKSGPHTWQGFDWQPAGPLAENGMVLAAAVTSGRLDGKTTRPAPRVEFFTWDLQARGPRLKSCRLADTGPLCHKGSDNFNAVCLASNGDVYGSIMGIRLKPYGCGPCPAGMKAVDPADKPERNAIYLWKANSRQWLMAARNIQMANGLALSSDGTRLSVSAITANAVVVFTRDPITGELSAPSTISLGPGEYPDNLSTLEGTTASAMTTGGFGVAMALLLGGTTGSSFGIRPAARVLGFDAAQLSSPVTLETRIPSGTGVFSGAAPLGNWWLCAQMLGSGIYCIPINPRNK